MSRFSDVFCIADFQLRNLRNFFRLAHGLIGSKAVLPINQPYILGVFLHRDWHHITRLPIEFFLFRTLLLFPHMSSIDK